MATFRVGQRVRKVRHSDCLPRESQRPIGSVGVVVAADGRSCMCGRHHDYDVAYEDGNPRRGNADAYMLEPIQPERNTVVSWESLGLPFDPRRVLEGVS